MGVATMATQGWIAVANQECATADTCGWKEQVEHQASTSTFIVRACMPFVNSMLLITGFVVDLANDPWNCVEKKMHFLL